MKAMVLSRTGRIEDRPLERMDLPVPKPGPGEVLVGVSVCGACHTDLDQVEGRLKTGKTPVVPGHQIVGRVAGLGKGAGKLKVGDRIGITWLNRSCGRCKFCARQMENLCEEALWTGKDADGGYGEYTVVGEDFAYKIPEAYSDEKAAPLLCAGVIGYRSIRLSEIVEGHRIGLFGFGASAHIVVQIIKHKWPENDVYVFTRGAEHKELAFELGADWCGSPTDSPPEKCDRIIDFTPVGETVARALAVLERGGRLVINAIAKTTAVPELDYACDLWLEKEVKSVANVTRLDAREFLPLAARAGVDPEVQLFNLEQANEVLAKIKHGGLRAAAVLRTAR